MAAYPIPPWLRSADMIRAGSAGAQIGLGQARMGLMAQENAQRMQLAEQAQQLSQQYERQMMAQRQAEDQQRQEEFEQQYTLQAQAAAAKFQAQQEYKNRVAAGEDPMEVLSELGPLMAVPGASQAAAMRYSMDRPQPAAPEWKVIDLTPDQKAAISSAGGFHFLPRPPAPARPTGQVTDSQRFARADRLRAQVRKILDSPDNSMYAERLSHDDPPDPDWKPTLQATYLMLKKQIEDLRATIYDLDHGGNGLGTGSQTPPPDQAQAAASGGGLGLSYDPATGRLTRTDPADLLGVEAIPGFQLATPAGTAGEAAVQPDQGTNQDWNVGPGVPGYQGPGDEEDQTDEEGQ